MLFVSLPVRGKDRNVIGAIAVVVAIDQVFRTLGKTHDGIAYWIADSAGQYLYQSRPETSGSHTQRLPTQSAISSWLTLGIKFCLGLSHN